MFNYNKKISTMCLLLLLLISSGCSASTIEWHMINVNFGRNQGDAHLLINGNVTTMIDAGYQGEAKAMVVPYLRKMGIKKIDHFFVSHPHRDHYEGMEAIQNAGIPIRNIYFNMPVESVRDCCYQRSHFLKYINAAKQRGARLHDIREGFKLEYSKDSVIEVLHAHRGTRINNRNVDVNDMSLIMRWTVKGWKTLFTGDLNHNVGTFLSTDKRMKADILKVPHHGGYGIAPKQFFENVGAQFNMFPGPAWVYTGERGALATTYSKANKIPHCVDGINGHVVLRFKDKIMLSSQKPSFYCANGALNIKKKTPNISGALFILLG